MKNSIYLKIFVMIAAMFVMNFGLGMINEASDAQFYLGSILTLAGLGTLAKVGHLFYLQIAPMISGNETPPE